MPPERSSTAEPDRLSVALDATPLLGRPTGVGAFCAGALSGLAERQDVDVSAFAVSWRRREPVSRLVPPGVSTAQHPMPARPLHATWRRVAVPPVEWFIGRHDVVHGTNFVVPPARSAARVVTVHDLTVVRFPELCDSSTLVFPELVRRAVAAGAWVHAPSEYVAGEVVDAFGIDPGRVRAVHHGVAHLARATSPGGGEAALPFRLPPGTGRYVLAIGTIEPRKDYPSLVTAFDALAGSHDDLALVIMGADGWGAERFGAAVEASPFRRRIVRLGYLDDAELAAVLADAAVLAFPSVYEGFGFPPLQAMSAGVPVVATAVGAVPEVVGDGGLLVPGRDVGALAAGLDHVLAGGPDIEAMVERGRRRSAGFTWSACAEGLVSLYRDARDDRNRRPAGGAMVARRAGP